jgi:hypothetical protein
MVTLCPGHICDWACSPVSILLSPIVSAPFPVFTCSVACSVLALPPRLPASLLTPQVEQRLHVTSRVFSISPAAPSACWEYLQSACDHGLSVVTIT